MKKIQINHRVEIENKALGLFYHVLLITKFEEKGTKQIVEMRRYNLNTGNELIHTKELASYLIAKKEFRKTINDILPC